MSGFQLDIKDNSQRMVQMDETGGVELSPYRKII